MRLCGVTDPAAVALNYPQMLCVDWLAPGRLANRLALQRCLGLSAAGVYERFGGYVATTSAERLAGRLLYLEQRGLLHLLAADKKAARRAWRQERGLPANEEATGEPAFISVFDCTRSDEHFKGKLPDSGAADFAAFKAGLLDSPAWRQLWAEAEAEAAQLNAQLEPQLRPGAAAAAAADEQEEEEEEEWGSSGSAP